MFLRPNFRHKDGKAHTCWSLVETVRTPEGPRQRTRCYLGELVALLGHALWVTLKHLLIRKGSSLSPAKALDLMSTTVSADIALPTTDRREIRLRRVMTPSEEQKQLLGLLGHRDTTAPRF